MENKINAVMLREEGYCILKNVANEDWVSRLTAALEKAFDEHRKIQVKNGNDIVTGGVALHVLLSDPVFLDFLKHLFDIGFIEEAREHFFRSKFILNSMNRSAV